MTQLFDENVSASGLGFQGMEHTSEEIVELQVPEGHLQTLWSYSSSCNIKLPQEKMVNQNCRETVTLLFAVI